MVDGVDDEVHGVELEKADGERNCASWAKYGGNATPMAWVSAKGVALLGVLPSPEKLQAPTLKYSICLAARLLSLPFHIPLLLTITASVCNTTLSCMGSFDS